MSAERIAGSNHGMTYMFAKTFVADLDAMSRFYEAVLGLVPYATHSDMMLGRPISEIMYQASYEGGPAFTMISYTDGNPPPPGEAVQGFVAADLAAACERALAHGGTVPEPIKEVPEYGIKVAFILDPEGHVLEVIEMVGQ